VGFGVNIVAPRQIFVYTISIFMPITFHIHLSIIKGLKVAPLKAAGSHKHKLIPSQEKKKLPYK
jgi:hypothetical protein